MGMSREEAIEYLERDNGNCDTDCKYCKYNNDCRSYKSRKMAIEALQTEPCEDAISRQATVERLCKVADFMNEKREGLGSPYVMAALFIQSNKDEFPPVMPQPKTGRWIAYEVRLPDRTILNYRCSVCGRQLIGYNTETLSEAPFCHCGAKMGMEET